MIENLTAAQLRRAAEIKDRISTLQKELNQLLGMSAPKAAPAKRARKRPVISPEGRARIAEAQRKRWAEAKSKKK